MTHAKNDHRYNEMIKKYSRPELSFVQSKISLGA